MLVSRMSSGEQVRLAAATVEQGLQRKITALEQQGYDTILLLCTGEFGTLKTTSALLLEPDRIIPPLVSAIVQAHKIGIVVPVEEQIAEQASKWRNLQSTPCFAVASPYLAQQSELIEAGLLCRSRALMWWCSTVSVITRNTAISCRKCWAFLCCCRMCWWRNWRLN
ncbi:hypothetical protein E05_38270 [Plautia stali symbiont]|nr:hypothetical protein E05_38270 [Plautia stali symbiont]